MSSNIRALGPTSYNGVIQRTSSGGACGYDTHVVILWKKSNGNGEVKEQEKTYLIYIFNWVSIIYINSK